MTVDEFLQKALGNLYANKAARQYMLTQIGKRNPRDIPQDEIIRIIGNAIEIALKDK